MRTAKHDKAVKTKHQPERKGRRAGGGKQMEKGRRGVGGRKKRGKKKGGEEQGEITREGR